MSFAIDDLEAFRESQLYVGTKVPTSETTILEAWEWLEVDGYGHIDTSPGPKGAALHV